MGTYIHACSYTFNVSKSSEFGMKLYLAHAHYVCYRSVFETATKLLHVHMSHICYMSTVSMFFTIFDRCCIASWHKKIILHVKLSNIDKVGRYAR